MQQDAYAKATSAASSHATTVSDVVEGGRMPLPWNTTPPTTHEALSGREIDEEDYEQGDTGRPLPAVGECV